MSEQLGWRSVVKNLRSELPIWGKVLPQLPRLLHEHLQQDLGNQMVRLLETLADQERRDKRRLRVIVALLALVLAFQLAPLVWMLRAG